MGKVSKFPGLLFVKQEQDGEVTYFVSDADPATLAEVGEKVYVASYKLLDVSELTLHPNFKKLK